MKWSFNFESLENISFLLNDERAVYADVNEKERGQASPSASKIAHQCFYDILCKNVSPKA